MIPFGSKAGGRSAPFGPIGSFSRLLKVEQLLADLGACPSAIGDSGEIADDGQPAQLALLQREMVVSGEAITHHNSRESLAKHLNRRCC